MQKTLSKKLIATLIGLILIIATFICFVPTQKAHAEEAIWEQIDYEKDFVEEITEAGIGYGGTVSELPVLKKYRYLYVFLASSGGMGGVSANEKTVGYGGGSGSFAVVRIDLKESNGIIIIMGYGGGKVEYGENDEMQPGEGYPSMILTLRTKTDDKPFLMDGYLLRGGTAGSTLEPGKGGIVQGIRDDNQETPLLKLIYSRDGVDGGQASQSFTVDLGFRKEYFIYRPTGANPSGKGGAASVYHRGGDGGVMYKNGSDGSMGAGGGGAGYGATQGGFGGDGYMEVYGSNM